MPLNLDSCITGIFVPGNIGASSGLPPVQPTVPSLDGDPPTVLEAAAASDMLDAIVIEVQNVEEATSASDVVDAVTVPGVTYATLDPATVTSVTLSGGNLVATNTGTTSTNQGAKSATGKTSGKYYFEVTFTAYSGAVARTMAGVGTSASTYAGMSTNGTSGIIGGVNGVVHANGVGSLHDFVPAGSLPAGGTMGIAVDLDNRKGWFRETPSGLWNGSATANPATNAEGVTIPAGTMVPYCTFGGTAGAAGNITTANFGASAFNGAVPSGFTSGWPA